MLLEAVRETNGELDAASDVGEIEPDFDAAEWSLRCNGCAIPARRCRAEPTYFGEFRVDRGGVRRLRHGGGRKFLLGIEAGCACPFVEKVEE